MLLFSSPSHDREIIDAILYCIHEESKTFTAINLSLNYYLQILINNYTIYVERISALHLKIPGRKYILYRLPAKFLFIDVI